MSTTIEHLVEEQLRTGKYRSREELLAEALRVLKARDSELERMKTRIREGEDAADRGELVEGELVIKEALERIEAFDREA